MFSPVRLLIQKLYLASHEAFRKLRASLPKHDICRGFNVGVFGGHFFLNNLQTVRVQALLSDTCYVRIHLAESAAPSGRSRFQSSINFSNRN